MKIQISPSGELEIFRSHGFKTQKCIYTEAKSCGDRCPHFGEPEQVFEHEYILVVIELCQGRLLKTTTSDFQDLRTKPESEYDYKLGPAF